MSKETIDTILKGVNLRISRSATLSLNADIDKVFPLFGPVLEKEWAYSWDPEIIFSGTDLVEEGMIFRTKGEEEHYTWVVTKYQPDNYIVEYTVNTSTRIWFILVACKQAGSKTLAKVTYTYTGLTGKGMELNRAALAKMFEFDLRDWEDAINFYLQTGRQLTPD